MKKRVIAIILSLVMAASGAGTHPVLAAETSAVEAATGQEESESAKNPGDVTGNEEAGGETDGAIGDETGQGTGETSGEASDGEAADPDSTEETPGEESDGEAADLDSTEGTSGEEPDGEAADPDSTDRASGEDDETDADSSTAADGTTAVDPNEITELVPDESTMKGEAAGTMLGAAEVSGLDADVHSQSEIRQFVREHLAPVIANTYEEEPSTTVPYSPGVLSDESTEAGFNALNQARYIAGIPADVEYDAGYTAKAQAGALVNAVNNKLDHYPDQPADMSDELFDLGYSGTSSSNLARGPVALARSVILWMSDSDSSNISAVGHRRWILEPSMKKAGFGAVGGFSAVYVRDESRGDTSYNRIAWPAQNMPLEFWNDEDAWHVTFGSYEPITGVVVTLTRKSDGRIWTFSEDSADGYFNFSPSGYFGGYVIFRPDDISYSSGDVFDVTISGTDGTTIAYTVNFFSICDGNHSYVSEKLSDPTCTTQGVTVKTCENCGKVTYEYAPATGHDFQVISQEDGLYTLRCDACGKEKTASVPASFYPYWKKAGTEGSYWSSVPTGLEAGDGLSYLIYIDSYTADASEHLSDITVETSDPEHCVLEEQSETLGTIRFLKDGTYTLTIYPTYNPDVKVTRSVKIVKPLESVTVLADPASPRPYGTSVKLEARADGGKGTLKYTFVAVDENGTESKLTNDAYGATYTWKPAGTGNYKLRADVKDTGDSDRVVSSDVLTYTVQQQPVRVKDGKTITADGTLTYGQPLSALQVVNAQFVGTLDGTAQAGTFAFEDPDEIPAAGTHTVNWTFTPDNTNYAKKSGSLTAEVKKAVPAIATAPTAADKTYHPSLTLKDVALTGAKVTCDGKTIEGSWKWTSESTSLKVPGGTYACRFVPSDSKNYESVETNVKVTVTKATPFIARITPKAITYGQTLGDSALSGTARYSKTDTTAVSGTFKWKDDTAAPVVSDSGVTSYAVIFTPADTGNYNSVEGKTTLTVNKAQRPSEMPPAELSVPHSTDRLSNEILRTAGIMNWSFAEASIGQALTAGETAAFTVNYTGSDKGNFVTETARVQVTRSNCDHNGTVTVRNAVEPTCTTEGQTGDTYCDLCGELLKASAVIPVIDHTWDDGKITKEPQIGSEGVRTYTCRACGKTKTESIPALLDIAAVSVEGIKNRNYTGKTITLKLTVTDGDKTLAAGTDYTVSYQNNLNPGTASVTITGTGSYGGEVVREFYILPGKTKRGDMFNLANGVKVTWEPVLGAKYYKVYREGVTDRSESMDEPVIVTQRPIGWDNKTGLTNGHAYRYKIVASLTDENDPSGDSTLSYSKLMYRLKTVVIRSANNYEPGKVKVRYDQTPTGDSYVLQWSDNEQMTGANTKVILGAKNTSYVITGLKKGKTYYIQIRVRKIVDGEKYYTTFGKIRKVKIEK